MGMHAWPSWQSQGKCRKFCCLFRPVVASIGEMLATPLLQKPQQVQKNKTNYSKGIAPVTLITSITGLKRTGAEPLCCCLITFLSGYLSLSTIHAFTMNEWLNEHHLHEFGALALLCL